MADASGAAIIVFDSAPVVSVPSIILSPVALRAHDFVPDAIRDPEALSRLLTPGRVARAVGPELLNYVDRSCFAPIPTRGTRALTPEDEGLFWIMRSACSPEDWEPKDFSLGLEPTFGTFVEDELVAVSGIGIWAHRIAQIRVVTHPEFRGRGFGSQVVAFATARALDMGLLPEYRVQEDNLPSRRVARKLGFQSHAWTLSATLRNPNVLSRWGV